MTEADFLKLPDEKKDKLVAESVMCKSWCQLMGENECLNDKPKKCKCGAVGFPYEHHPPYTTSIEAAWEVVEKLHMHVEGPNPQWIAWTEGATGTVGDTAPLAICLAALKAVGAID